VQACPNKALDLHKRKAIVSHPLACDYTGICEAVCPLNAIARPFEIVIMEGNEPIKSDKSR
jgi:NAD-dependent dihydropyrimidine dehydrogenase PreA subunit